MTERTRCQTEAADLSFLRRGAVVSLRGAQSRAAPPGGDPGADPGHVAEIICLCWPGESPGGARGSDWEQFNPAAQTHSSSPS